MANLTIKKIDDRILERLRARARRCKVSINSLVKSILAEHLGVKPSRSNDLSDLAGSWSAEDVEEFEQNTGQFRDVDPEIWK